VPTILNQVRIVSNGKYTGTFEVWLNMYPNHTTSCHLLY